MTAVLDPLRVSAFLLAAFMLAGLAQAWWLSSPAARRFGQPLDAGFSLRGRRVFGPNKTVRGLMVMVPATAAAFVIMRAAFDAAGLTTGLWTMGAPGYFGIGLVAGVGFMAGELPNSFVKRQLDIPPGEAAGSRGLALVFAIADRLDSAAGMLLALSLVAGVPWSAVALLLIVGPVVHGGYSLLTYELGGKARPA